MHNVGTWTVKAVSGSDTDSKSVSITSSGQSRSVELSFVKIYGISRDITATSPAWARTDSAVGKTATATAVSYTHLDVYKRQGLGSPPTNGRRY